MVYLGGRHVESKAIVDTSICIQHHHRSSSVSFVMSSLLFGFPCWVPKSIDLLLNSQEYSAEAIFVGDPPSLSSSPCSLIKDPSFTGHSTCTGSRRLIPQRDYAKVQSYTPPGSAMTTVENSSLFTFINYYT